MPELPDLHVFAGNLSKRILNKNILSVTVYDTRKIATPDYYRQKLTGTFINEIERNGKELFFKLANKNCFSVHLMLSGRFFIGNRDEAEMIKSKIIGLCFDDGGRGMDSGENFVVSDIQGLCRVSLNPGPPGTPDAMSPKFTWEYFLRAIKKSAYGNIKALLIDQKFVRGIGNAYADEILWKAGISPESFSGKIPEEKLRTLYEAIPFVFNDAIENIQRLAPEIISGEERSFLRVHNRDKKTTDECDRIIVKTIAGKTTYFTDNQTPYR
jgi:formamidopyrimidine-DNA glycosylase